MANQNQRNAPQLPVPPNPPNIPTPAPASPPVKTSSVRDSLEQRQRVLALLQKLASASESADETIADPITDAANLRKLQEQPETKVAECDDCQQTETCDTCKQTPCNCDAIAKLAKDMARLMLGTQCKTCNKAQCTCGRTASPAHDLAQ